MLPSEAYDVSYKSSHGGMDQNSWLYHATSQPSAPTPRTASAPHIFSAGREKQDRASSLPGQDRSTGDWIGTPNPGQSPVVFGNALEQPMQAQVQYGLDFSQPSSAHVGIPAHSNAPLFHYPSQAPLASQYGSVQPFQPESVPSMGSLPDQSQYVPPYTSSGGDVAGQSPMLQTPQPLPSPLQNYTSGRPSGQKHGHHPSLTSTATSAGTDESIMSAATAFTELPTPTWPDTDQIDSTFIKYLHRIKAEINSEQLLEAGYHLVEMSEWVHRNAHQLDPIRPGELLSVGEAQKRQDLRTEFWDAFNYLWLGQLQKERRMSVNVRGGKQIASRDNAQQHLDMLEKMGDTIVSMCNTLVAHGLVDYQRGVWEDRIIDMIIRCQQPLEEFLDQAGSSKRRKGGKNNAAHDSFR